METRMPSKYPLDLLKGFTILIVDDEEDSLAVARYLLEFHGATVRLASNGQEGLENARALKPDFILSDISMPQVDGWEMIKRLKSDPVLVSIPVIALTAHALRGDREKALDAGFHNYLTKPLTVSTFIRDIIGLLVDIPVIAKRLPSGLGD